MPRTLGRTGVADASGAHRTAIAGAAAAWRRRGQRGGRSLYSRDVNAEFNYWLLIVGLVVGAGLVWLVLSDTRRRDADLGELEREGEAQWIAGAMLDAGRDVDEADVLDVLRLHAAYLAAPPPDEGLDASQSPSTDRWIAVAEPTATGAGADLGWDPGSDPSGDSAADADPGPAPTVAADHTDSAGLSSR